MTRRARRNLVRRRAGDRCEYCQISQDDVLHFPFHVEHIIARKHKGADHVNNLCWSCHSCNLFKSSNLSGIDPDTGMIVPLFHPRRQQWHVHFQWHGPRLVGRTACGRATIAVLCINLAHRVRMRRFLILAGVFPP
jgi:hypothetical protein